MTKGKITGSRRTANIRFERLYDINDVKRNLIGDSDDFYLSMQYGVFSSNLSSSGTIIGRKESNNAPYSNNIKIPIAPFKKLFALGL